MIDKRLVYEAYKAVKSNGGAAGVDGQTIEQFEADLKGNLYKIWICLDERRRIVDSRCDTRTYFAARGAPHSRLAVQGGRFAARLRSITTWAPAQGFFQPISGNRIDADFR